MVANRLIEVAVRFKDVLAHKGGSGHIQNRKQLVS